MTFSIIIPTRNRIASLIEAIKSIQQQTFSDWEIVVVDDASDVNVKEALKPLLSNKVKYLRNERALGPGGARNVGIRSADASSTYISLLDDDDTYYPEFLQRTYDALRNSPDEIGFSWTGIENYYVGKNTSSKFFWDPPFQTKEEAYQGFLVKRLIGTGYGITFKKNVFDKVGYFDELLRAVEDTDFFLRVLQSFFYIKIPDVLVRITRQTVNHVNSNTVERAEALESIYQKHYDNILKNKIAWYNFNAKILSIYYRLGNRTKARRIVTNSLKEYFSTRILILWLRLEILGK